MEMQEFEYCFACFVERDIELYTFDANEASEWLADSIAEMFSSGGSGPSENDYEQVFVRAISLKSLKKKIGKDAFEEFIYSNVGKWA